MEIKLTGSQGGIAIISSDDFENISKYKWFRESNGYARGSIDGKLKLMHRIIKGEPKDKVVDHINGDRLDNRRENLRIVTRKENAQNVKRSKINTTSIYMGVYHCTNSSKYRASICHDNKFHHIGTFSTEKEAADARDMYIIHNKLELYPLNFPDKKKIISKGLQLVT